MSIVAPRHRPDRAESAERNIEIVLQKFSHLAGNAFRVLVCMALYARQDETGGLRYQGGPGPLMLALGRVDPPPHEVGAEANGVRHSNDVTLRKAVAELLRPGVVTYAVRPSKGSYAQFWLHLDEPAAAELGTIYYLRLNGIIKIGWTGRPVTNRLRSFPPGVELLAIHPGDIAMERSIHRELAEHLIDREWFHPSSVVMDKIQSVVDAYGPPNLSR